MSPDDALLACRLPTAVERFTTAAEARSLLVRFVSDIIYLSYPIITVCVSVSVQGLKAKRQTETNWYAEKLAIRYQLRLGQGLACREKHRCASSNPNPGDLSESPFRT